jgi:sugar phosphate permease
MSEANRVQRVMFMITLIVAGEAVFGLPFHVTRFFRPTVLEVFGLTNTELGTAQAVYGVVAMLAYFPGGPLADRFPARRLLTASLVLTSLGGIYFATFPVHRRLWALFGFWGLSTILLFWAALIRATREWGGKDEQGRAYGMLDGGRGLFAALLAAAAVFLFQALVPADPESATTIERARALRAVIYAYTLATTLAALLSWHFVPEGKGIVPSESATSHLRTVIRMRAVWLQAVIVVCAYVAYKGVDNYALFAVQAYEMNELQGARVAATSAWVRPFAALGAGWLGDRITSSRVTASCFAILLGSYVWFGLANPRPSLIWALYMNVLISCIAIFGLRGVYFALFQEASVPMQATGTAVGLVSFIGYTPDVFVNLVAGWLLDRSPGIEGHRHVFAFLGAFALLGLASTFAFRRTIDLAEPRNPAKGAT